MTTQSNGNNVMIQGRIVWVSGDLFTGRQKKDVNTKQLLLNQDGTPKIEYGFGLAIPKIDPATGQNSADYVKIWQALHAEALSIYPNGQIPPGFAMKFKDGDSIDDKGKPFADREGYKGHIVLACTTQIPINYFIYQGGNNVLVNTGIKCGDYVDVQLNIKAHPAVGTWKAGLYVNPSAVRLIQPGKEIINAPSGDQIFGQNAPGYNGQVVADTAPQMPNMQAPMAPQGAPAMPQQAQPHYQVLPQGMQPGQAPQMPVQPAIPQQMHGMQAPATPTIPQATGYAQPAYPSNMPQAQQQQGVPVMPQMP